MARHYFVGSPTIDYLVPAEHALDTSTLNAHTNKFEGTVRLEEGTLVFQSTQQTRHVLGRLLTPGHDPYAALGTQRTLGGNVPNAFAMYSKLAQAFQNNGMRIPDGHATLLTAAHPDIDSYTANLRRYGVDGVANVRPEPRLAARRSLHIPGASQVTMLGSPVQPLQEIGDIAHDTLAMGAEDRVVLPGAIAPQPYFMAALPSTRFVSSLAEHRHASPLAKYTELPWQQAGGSVPSVMERDDELQALNNYLNHVLIGKNPQPHPLATIGTELGTIFVLTANERVLCLENTFVPDGGAFFRRRQERFAAHPASRTGRGDAIAGAAEVFPLAVEWMQTETSNAEQAMIGGALLTHYLARFGAEMAFRTAASNLSGVEQELFDQALETYVAQVRTDLQTLPPLRSDRVTHIRSPEGRAALWWHPTTLDRETVVRNPASA